MSSWIIEISNGKILNDVARFKLKFKALSRVNILAWYHMQLKYVWSFYKNWHALKSKSNHKYRSHLAKSKQMQTCHEPFKALSSLNCYASHIVFVFRWPLVSDFHASASSPAAKPKLFTGQNSAILRSHRNLRPGFKWQWNATKHWADRRPSRRWKNIKLRFVLLWPCDVQNSPHLGIICVYIEKLHEAHCKISFWRSPPKCHANMRISI